jgi:transcriptional regulator with XRE-family HTH domain
MTATQYQRARKKVGYSNYALCRLLGVSLRQAQRYESGEAEIPETIARLLIMYQRFGVPNDLV